MCFADVVNAFFSSLIADFGSDSDLGFGVEVGVISDSISNSYLGPDLGCALDYPPSSLNYGFTNSW